MRLPGPGRVGSARRSQGRGQSTPQTVKLAHFSTVTDTGSYGPFGIDQLRHETLPICGWPYCRRKSRTIQTRIRV